MEYITVEMAADKMGVTPHAIWLLIKRGSLKAVKTRSIHSKKIDPILHTTDEWIEEYKANKWSKQKHMTHNGRPTYDPEKGIYSVMQAAAILGVNRRRMHYLIDKGKVKATRKSYYYVIARDDLVAYMKSNKQEVKYA